MRFTYNDSCVRVWLGHLAQDCFHRPGDKAYELIEDDALLSTSAADVSHSDTVHKKKVVQLCLLVRCVR